MARPKQAGKRVLGPYEYPGGWRLVFFNADGKRSSRAFATETEALKALRQAEAEWETVRGKTLDEALDDYEAYRRDDKGNKSVSVKETSRRLRRFFHDHHRLLAQVDATRAPGYYQRFSTLAKKNGQPDLRRLPPQRAR